MTRRADFQNIRNAFRHRDYALFVGGMSPATVTVWMHRVAVGWLAWELTRSPTWGGIIGFAGGAVACFAAWGPASHRRRRMIPALEAEEAG